MYGRGGDVNLADCLRVSKALKPAKEAVSVHFIGVHPVQSKCCAVCKRAEIRREHNLGRCLENVGLIACHRAARQLLACAERVAQRQLGFKVQVEKALRHHGICRNGLSVPVVQRRCQQVLAVGYCHVGHHVAVTVAVVRAETHKKFRHRALVVIACADVEHALPGHVSAGHDTRAVVAHISAEHIIGKASCRHVIPRADVPLAAHAAFDAGIQQGRRIQAMKP